MIGIEIPESLMHEPLIFELRKAPLNLNLNLKNPMLFPKFAPDFPLISLTKKWD